MTLVEAPPTASASSRMDGLMPCSARWSSMACRMSDRLSVTGSSSLRSSGAPAAPTDAPSRRRTRDRSSERLGQCGRRGLEPRQGFRAVATPLGRLSLVCGLVVIHVQSRTLHHVSAQARLYASTTWLLMGPSRSLTCRMPTPFVLVSTASHCASGHALATRCPRCGPKWQRPESNRGCSANRPVLGHCPFPTVRAPMGAAAAKL